MQEKCANEKSSFFQNWECEYFPCHKTAYPEDFNCLFCYCPLYALGEKCGGNFTYTERGIKNCTGCLLPHGRRSVERIAERFPELAELAKRSGCTERNKTE